MKSYTTVVSRSSRRRLDLNYQNPKEVSQHKFLKSDKTRFAVAPMSDFFTPSEPGFQFFQAGSNSDYHKAVSELALAQYQRCASLEVGAKGLSLLSERQGGASETVQTTFENVSDNLLINSPSDAAVKSFVTNGADKTILDAVILAKDKNDDTAFIKATIRNSDGSPKPGVTITPTVDQCGPGQVDIRFENFECSALDFARDDASRHKTERLSAAMYQLGEVRLALKQINKIARLKPVVDSSGSLTLPLMTVIKQEVTSLVARYMALYSCCKATQIDLSNIKINTIKLEANSLLNCAKELLRSVGGSVANIFPDESQLHLWPGNNRLLAQEVARDVIDSGVYASFNWTDDDFRIVYPGVTPGLRLLEIIEGKTSQDRMSRVFRARERATRVVLSQQIVSADNQNIDAHMYWLSACSDHINSLVRSATENSLFRDFFQSAQVAHPSISPTLNSWSILYGMNCIVNDFHYLISSKLITTARYYEFLQLQKQYVDDLMLDTPEIIDCL
eukprot:TRINITY_DN9607_c1_g1_i1.p1 TRINITY_DN9607_c1_g1~~TRINITY_DN9607_c1_g1_i1.p1  ORF type:complete len:505 (+),score=79.23 TRINITY_DN9607_c1_g1_i1:571-2085(+)